MTKNGIKHYYQAQEKKKSIKLLILFTLIHNRINHIFYLLFFRWEINGPSGMFTIKLAL